jgi:hypothetical protein
LVAETELKFAAKPVLAIDFEELNTVSIHHQHHYSKASISWATSTQATVPNPPHLTVVKTS